jgi:diadenosine tetraphosphate (Ap4A) HIT family hydrolase
VGGNGKFKHNFSWTNQTHALIAISPKRAFLTKVRCLSRSKSPGHTLIIPRRHVESYFDLTNQEREDMTALMIRVRSKLKDELNPIGFNIGINEGFAAGQTVSHINMHLIPRYKGDVAEPRGGIRWIFPDKAVFWNAKPAATPEAP